MRRFLAMVFLLAACSFAQTQTVTRLADSIRIRYNIPELAFAVVSADTIFETGTLGVQRINSTLTARPGDRFHIGSNTKAITSFNAALLVAQRRIAWDTRFFDLFPELKSKSRKAYHDITLKQLLTFRGKLPSYTYTFTKPTKKEIRGDKAEQRYALAKYFLGKKPMQPENGLTPSNADYILAGLMLERAAGQSFVSLVNEFGSSQGISFGFGYPNESDTLQPWGHDGNLNPLPPSDNYKLDWLLCAGNINVSIDGYIKFIQLQLKGLKGQTSILPSQTFDTLLYGLPVFSFGWFNKTDGVTNQNIAYNEGNAGAFITRVEIIKETGRAYIVFTNCATTEAGKGVVALVELLKGMNNGNYVE